MVCSGLWTGQLEATFAVSGWIPGSLWLCSVVEALAALLAVDLVGVGPAFGCVATLVSVVVVPQLEWAPWCMVVAAAGKVLLLISLLGTGHWSSRELVYGLDC